MILALLRGIEHAFGARPGDRVFHSHPTAVHRTRHGPTGVDRFAARGGEITQFAAQPSTLFAVAAELLGELGLAVAFELLRSVCEALLSIVERVDKILQNSDVIGHPTHSFGSRSC